MASFETEVKSRLRALWAPPLSRSGQQLGRLASSQAASSGSSGGPSRRVPLSGPGGRKSDHQPSTNLTAGFKVGAPVTLKGLNEFAAYNGKKGMIVSRQRDSDGEWWIVELTNPKYKGKRISVTVASLALSPAAEAVLWREHNLVLHDVQESFRFGMRTV